MKDLQVIYDSAKSFYGKAKVENFFGDDKSLYSYNTLVATIKANKLTIYNLQSTTTCRHVREFVRQNETIINNISDLKDYSKKELSKLLV